MKVCVLASSSSGNSTFIGTDRTRILIDAGISKKELFARLAEIGEDPHGLDAVLVSHEHSDHVGGLIPVLRGLEKGRHTRVPVYLSRLTAPSIAWGEFTPHLQTFQSGDRFCVGDLEIGTFTIPHDAVDPVGFTVRAGAAECGVVTDLGYMPGSIRFHLMECSLLVLESNHDIEMLKVGPYPWSVKQRVMGRKGHLSNDVVSDFILDGLDGRLRTLVLGHLSEHNNHPAIVHMSASQALARRGLRAGLSVVEPGVCSKVFTV